jgi:hypothetical protein
MPAVKILIFLDLDEKSSFSFGHYLKRQANVAQLVEQLTRNEQARGSNPRIGSKMTLFIFKR